MKKVFVFLADGFEEVEAITPIDYLRRAGCNVKIVSLGARTVVSSRGIQIGADVLVSDVLDETPDMVVFPGGLDNAKTAGTNEVAEAITKRVFKKGYVAAICAAPALVLAPWGILDGKKYTCFPGMDEDLPVRAESARVVVDGNLITSRGAGCSEEFTFKLVEILCGAKALAALKKAVVAR